MLERHANVDTGSTVRSRHFDGDAGSFVDPADARLCLGGDGPGDYSGPTLDFRVVDSRKAETRSGMRGLALMVSTSVYEDLDSVAQNLAANPDGYDAVELTIFARELAFYTPSEGVTVARCLFALLRSSSTTAFQVALKG